VRISKTLSWESGSPPRAWTTLPGEKILMRTVVDERRASFADRTVRAASCCTIVQAHLAQFGGQRAA